MNSETELFDLEEQYKDEDGDWHTQEGWDNLFKKFADCRKDHGTICPFIKEGILERNCETANMAAKIMRVKCKKRTWTICNDTVNDIISNITINDL